MRSTYFFAVTVLCLHTILRAQVDENKTREFHGVVEDQNGRPANEVVLSLKWHNGQSRATSDSNGRFQLNVPEEFVGGRTIYASREGGKFQASIQLPWELKDIPKLLTLKLMKAKRIECVVVDGEQKPIAGARVGILGGFEEMAGATTNENGQVVDFVAPDAEISDVYAMKANVGFDYHSYVIPVERRGDIKAKKPEIPDVIRLQLNGTKPLRIRVVDDANSPVAGIPVYPWLLKKEDEPEKINLSAMVERVRTLSDEAGVASFDWLPSWDTRKVQTFFAITEEYDGTRLDFDASKGKPPVIRLQRLVEVGGIVTNPDGSPAVGIDVMFVGANYSLDRTGGSASTGEDGRYKVRLSPTSIYMALTLHPELSAAPLDGVTVQIAKSQNDLNFKLRQATRVKGKVTIGRDRKPIPGEQINIYQYGKSASDAGVKLPNPENSNRSVRPIHVHYAATNDNGEFDFSLGPGKFDIRGPKGSLSSRFEISDDGQGHEFNFHTIRPEKGMLSGFVTTVKPIQPVPNATVHGIYQHPSANYRDFKAESDENGHFKIERGLHRMTLYAVNDDNTLAGAIQIDPDTKLVRIPMRPLASAQGRLVDLNGEPMREREIEYGVRVHDTGDEDSAWITRFGGTTTTDKNGHFKLTRLVLGQLYHLNVSIGAMSSTSVGTIRPERVEEFDLGDVEFAQGAQSRLARIRTETESRHTAARRLEIALADGKLQHRHPLMVFADPKSVAASAFYFTRDINISRQKFDFTSVWISTVGPNAAEAAELGTKLGVDITGKSLTLVPVGSDGKALATLAGEDFISGNDVDAAVLGPLLSAHAAVLPNVAELLATAMTNAKQQGKRVLVQQQSRDKESLMLSQWLDRHRNAVESDFVWIGIDAVWPGGDAIIKKLREQEQAPAPWLGILDAKGDVQSATDMAGGGRLQSPIYRNANLLENFFRTAANNMSAEDIDLMIDELRNP